jgi:PPOX class probable F420-dependent enzyme
MAIEIGQSASDYISRARVGRLATVDENGHPFVVPICYAFDGEHIYSPIDEKAKLADIYRLKRLRNIKANPRVSLVIDEYTEDWSGLSYLLVSGIAEIIGPEGPASTEHTRAVRLLRKKYEQYEMMAIDTRPMIKITPTRIKEWTAC